ncbi:flagellar biosynthesis protein FlhB [Methyloversatilis thermotolerans]|uniref:flagellar biosynthesis protein FlhB n=1 Tax=Methyloversatilis thermotolerans TaxID=1346290 RepID=UPI000369B4CD|nr:flagellar biosynthesis protein FlhB [Methyloversatilis thermotolerans]
MAEESDLEKTEPASQRRLDQAREEGQVPSSRELATFLVTVTGVAGIYALGGWMWPRSAQLLRDGLTLDRRQVFDPSAMFDVLIDRATDGLVLLAPLFIALIVASLLSPFLMAGWNFAPKALAPKFSKLNPAAGLKRMVSTTALIELGKGIGKASVVAAVAVWVIMRDHEKLFALFGTPIDVALGATGDLVLMATLILVAGMAFIVAIDVPYQVWHYHDGLKMTKEEARQEFKEQEGDPQVKGRIRQQQREMARSRMMANVPKADVVVTNPTHYSVALRYDAARGGAPRVIAKGAGEVALRIRTLAAEHDVPLVEAPPLARALHKHCELEQEVPARLFRAVAEVLAYVYQLNEAFAAGSEKPRPPGNLPVPEDLDPGADD